MLHHGLLHPFTSTAKRFWYTNYALAIEQDGAGWGVPRTVTEAKGKLTANLNAVVKRQRDDLWWTEWDKVLTQIDRIFAKTSPAPLLRVGRLLNLATSIGSAGRQTMAAPGMRAMREMLLQSVAVGMRGAMMCTPVVGKQSEWGT